MVYDERLCEERHDRIEDDKKANTIEHQTIHSRITGFYVAALSAAGAIILILLGIVGYFLKGKV